MVFCMMGIFSAVSCLVSLSYTQRADRSHAARHLNTTELPYNSELRRIPEARNQLDPFSGIAAAIGLQAAAGGGVSMLDDAC
jgi:hypothetical protein